MSDEKWNGFRKWVSNSRFDRKDFLIRFLLFGYDENGYGFYEKFLIEYRMRKDCFL